MSCTVIYDNLLERLQHMGEDIEIFQESTQTRVFRNRIKVSEILLGKNGNTSQIVNHTSQYQDNISIFIEIESLSKFDILENAYSEAIGKDYELQLENLLQRIGMENQTFRILKRRKEFILHTISEGKAIPVYFSGDGYKRLLYVACILASSTNKLVLLEEPECFQHPRYIRELSQLLWGAVDQGTQIMMSTHSIDLLHQLFFQQDAPLEKSKIFRTQLKHGRLSARAIEGQRARDRMDELGEDLR